MLENIFNEPSEVENILLYPVLMRDYDRFNSVNDLLYLNVKHFEIKDKEYDYKLLDLILSCGDTEKNINNLKVVFEIVTQKKVFFANTGHYYCFVIGGDDEDKKIIDRDNYDKIRETIMKQNLLIEPKVFKNKVTQKWAEKVLKAKSKNAPKITIEDMLSTISAKTGKHYHDLKEYSIYQIHSDFYRINKDRDYDAKLQGSEIEMKHFAESLDLYHSPYDDLFVDKNKLKNINNALKSD